MKNLVAVSNRKTKYPSDLPRAFCNSTSDLVKGVLVEFKGSYLERQTVIIDNPNNLSLKELLRELLIGYDKNIVMDRIENDVIDSPFFVPIEDYRNEIHQIMVDRKKEILKRHRLRKDYENNNYVFTKEEVNKIYESLNLPKAKGINKADYLEFYMYYGNNLNRYQLFKELKERADVPWRDFRRLSFKAINKEDKLRVIRHSSSSITKETYTSR